MTQLGLAAGQEKPLEYLRSQGIDVPDNTSLPGITVALTEALGNHSAYSPEGWRSDRHWILLLKMGVKTRVVR
jgi:hypothetical protein